VFVRGRFLEKLQLRQHRGNRGNRGNRGIAKLLPKHPARDENGPEWTGHSLLGSDANATQRMQLTVFVKAGSGSLIKSARKESANEITVVALIFASARGAEIN